MKNDFPKVIYAKMWYISNDGDYMKTVTGVSFGPGDLRIVTECLDK